MNELIILARKLGFKSVFFTDEPYKYSFKESVRHVLYLEEMKMWFRENYNLHILVQVGGFVNNKQTFYCNVFKFGKNLYRSYFRSKTSIYTYEQALEAGLLKACKLIKK